MINLSLRGCREPPPSKLNVPVQNFTKRVQTAGQVSVHGVQLKAGTIGVLVLLLLQNRSVPSFEAFFGLFKSLNDHARVYYVLNAKPVLPSQTGPLYQSVGQFFIELFAGFQIDHG